MVARKRCHLREMGNHDHLPVLRNLRELFADLLRSAPGNTSVHLVKNQCLDVVPVSEYVFDRKHDPGKLTSGRDLCQRFGLLTNIGGDKQFQLVRTVQRHLLVLLTHRKLHRWHVQKDQFSLYRLHKQLRRFGARLCEPFCLTSGLFLEAGKLGGQLFNPYIRSFNLLQLGCCACTKLQYLLDA